MEREGESCLIRVGSGTDASSVRRRGGGLLDVVRLGKLVGGDGSRRMLFGSSLLGCKGNTRGQQSAEGGRGERKVLVVWLPLAAKPRRSLRLLPNGRGA